MAGPDGPLVSAARAGEEDAWRELYALHARRLELWLASLPAGDPSSSPEDVASEAWLTAAGKIDEFSGSDDDFAGWLFTIARLTLNNRRRTAQRRRTDPAEPDGSDAAWGIADSPEGSVVGQAETRRMLALLSPRESEVLACLEVVGLDVATTARVLDMAPTAVRVARHRALRRLRKELGQPEDL
ncbi:MULTISPECIES: RNA polymerase sigma factor [unclassified Nocardioides]|uniref:RNA polymerase sigma factor n=1 Tax=unclassified Nocardioides TaxID=2615069 RepID=UPI00360B534F